MSKTVDERVVSMRFDNAQFEKGVQTSMSTLEKLKQKLNLSGAAKGLEEVSAASKKVDMSGLGNGIETVHSKFSALQVMGVTALANITNSAVNAGKKIVSALTIDPVRSGFQEYETQINSVQTILANTSKEGTNVKDVNAALDELNTYADKTIYNFTEMTRNIGTFTAAGVKLDDSVNAIQGIANLAAVSGSNSQQASTAMYQLSQALAAGKVNLQDWNSVVNAGMGGKVFQDALIRTSEHLKTGAKQAIKTNGSFRESIKSGWITQEVLTETLSQFSTAADTQEEYEAAIKKFVSQGYTKQEAKEMADMARTAGNAATKVKTFTQLIDTLKEALGSGWAKTWRIIIGDFEEAKELWTSVSDVLVGFIDRMSDARNKLLESALGKGFTDEPIDAFRELGETADKLGMPLNEFIDNLDKITGRWLLINSFKNIGKSLVNVFSAIGDAWNATFKPMSADKLFDVIAAFHKFTASIKTFTEENGDKLTRTFKGLFAAIDIVRTILGGGLHFALKAVSAVLGAFDMNILDVTANIGDAIVAFRDFLFNNKFITTSFTLLGEGVKYVVESFKKLVETIKSIPKVQEALEKLKNIDLKEIGKNIVSGLKNGLKDGVTSIPQMLIELGKSILESIKNVLGIHSPSTEMYDVGTNIIEGLINGIKDGLSKVVDTLKEIGIKTIDTVKNIDWDNVFTGGISVALLFFIKRMVDILDSVTSPLSGAGDVLSSVSDTIDKSSSKIAKIIGNTAKVIKSFSKVLKAKAFKIKAEAIRDLAISLAILAASVYLLAQLDTGDLWGAVGAITVLALVLVALSFAVSKMSDASISIGKEGIDVKGLKSTLIAIGIALLIMAATVKLMGSMNLAQATQGFVGLVGLTGVMISVIAAFGKLVKGDTAANIDKLGKMMTKMALAMLLMTVVVKLISKLEWGEMGKAAVFVAGFTAFVLALTAITRLGQNGMAIDGLGGMMLKLSTSMLLMVGVVKLVGQLSADEMKKGAAFAAAFVLFVGLLTIITNLTQGTKNLGSLMLKMSLAMMLMVGVVKLVGQLSADEMKKGAAFAAAFVLFVAALVAVTTIGSKEKIAKVAGTIVAVSIAIAILASMSVILGLIDTKMLKKGVVAVGILGVLMIGMIRATENAKDVKGSIMAMAVAIAVMAVAVAALSLIDPTKLYTAVGALGILMIAFGIMGKLSSEAGEAMESLIVMTVVVALLGGLLIGISQIPTQQVLVAVGALSVVLLALSGAMYIISNTGDVSGKAILTLAMMAVIVLALTALVSQLTGIASMPIANIAASMLLLSGAMAVIAVAVNLMNGAVAGAAALIMVSSALTIFLPVLQQLGTMSLGEIGTSLLMLAGTFAVLGVAGLLLSPIAPILVILGAAIALIGAGAMMAGAGIKAFAEGLAMLVSLGPAGVTTITNSVLAMIELIPKIIATLITSLVESITNAIPNIVNCILTMINRLLAAISNNLPTILTYGTRIIMTLLRGIRANIKEVVKVVADIIVEFIEGISEKLPDIIQAGVDLVFAFIDGISDAFANNGDRAREALIKLGKSMLKGIKEFFGIHSPSTVFKDIGSQLISGLKKGISGNVSGAVSKIVELGGKMVKGIKEKASDFLSSGKELLGKLKDGIGDKSKINEIKDSIKDAVSKAKDKIKDKKEDFESAGKDLMNGLKDGINSMKEDIKSATSGISKSVVNKFKDILGIHSPSKVFFGFGRYIDEGLVNGLKQYSSKTANAAKYVGDGAIRSMSKAMSQVSDLIDSDMDSRPYIRPVVDLSDVKTGVGAISSMFGGNYAIGLDSEVSAVNTMMNKRQNGNFNSDLLSAVNGLRDDFASSANGVTVEVNLDYNASSDANQIANDIAVSLRRAIRRGV